MPALHHFYLAPNAWQAPFLLDTTESHHLSRVLRIKPGQTVRLFDGQGKHGLFTVQSVGKNRVALALQQEEIATPPTTGCTLAAGYSKALRRGWFLEKAVELEAQRLWFWQGEHSQATLPDVEKTAWQGSLLAGAKQSGNPWLPTMHAIPGGAGAIAAKASEFDRAFMLYEGETKGRLLTHADLSVPGSILLVIGPEGGFSTTESTVLAKAGVLPVSLGKRILRWETAAILALGMAWWARQ